MDRLAEIQENVVKRLLCDNREDYALQKFLNCMKYKSLINTGSLYISRSDRFNDDEEGFLFLQNSIENIGVITKNYADKCAFTELQETLSPYERCRILESVDF